MRRRSSDGNWTEGEGKVCSVQNSRLEVRLYILEDKK